MALVKMSVQMIENHLLATAFPEAVEVRIHSRPEFLGTLCEGILAFDADGTCIAANRSACFQLGRSLHEVRTSRFETLFNQPVSTVLDHALARGAELLRLTMHNGVKVAAQVRPGRVWRCPAPRCPARAPARPGGPDSSYALDQPPGQPPQDAESQRALINRLNELKLIREMQVEVNDRTKLYYQQDQAEQADDPQVAVELRELSKRQQEIYEATRSLATGKNR